MGKTLAELYQEKSVHRFGDISLIIENQGGKLRGKFIIHYIDADNEAIENTLKENGIPTCFASPPIRLNSDVVAKTVWDENYKTLDDIIPIIQAEIEEFGEIMRNIGNRLSMCATCKFFDRCYKIAELNLKREAAKHKILGKWEIE